MIVGGYSLHLYCDNVLHAFRHPDKVGSLDAEFAGHERADCRKDAKAKGWKLDFKKGTACCPKCQRLDKEDRL